MWSHSMQIMARMCRKNELVSNFNFFSTGISHPWRSRIFLTGLYSLSPLESIASAMHKDKQRGEITSLLCLGRRPTKPAVILPRIRCQNVALESLGRRKDTTRDNNAHPLPTRIRQKEYFLQYDN